MKALPWLAALAVILLVGCGQNKFQQEVENETLAVGLARETQEGEYKLVTTAELQQMLDEKQELVLVDAMPQSNFEKEHLPGAVSFAFPIEIMQEWDDRQTGGTQEAYEQLLGDDKEKLIVVYCGFVQCTRSHNAAVFARKLGYTNVRRHPGGIFAWKGAGHGTESE